MQHAGRRRFVVAHRVVDAHTNGLGVADEFGDRILHMRIARLALLLGDEVGEANHDTGFLGRHDQPERALP